MCWPASRLFLLVRPDGGRYAMSAYAQIIDKSLSYADLPALGARLRCRPAGATRP